MFILNSAFAQLLKLLEESPFSLIQSHTHLLDAIMFFGVPFSFQQIINSLHEPARTPCHSLVSVPEFCLSFYQSQITCSGTLIYPLWRVGPYSPASLQLRPALCRHASIMLVLLLRADSAQVVFSFYLPSSDSNFQAPHPHPQQLAPKAFAWQGSHRTLL